MAQFKLTINFVVGCVVVFGIHEVFSGPISAKLKLAASADGKSYFADDTGRNWTNAGAYCQSLGMELATVTSKAQEEALAAAYDETDFNGLFWTAGRDAQLPRQFSWNITGDEVSSDYYFSLNAYMPFETCLGYTSRSDYPSGFFYWHCSAFWGSLCET